MNTFFRFIAASCLGVSFYLVTVAMACTPNDHILANCVDVFHPLYALLIFCMVVAIFIYMEVTIDL